MLGTDEIPGRWALSGSNIPNVGDTGKYMAEFTADVHPEYYMPLTADVTLDIAKAQAPAMADTALSCYWGASGEKSVSLAGLPENTGEIYPATIVVSDVNGILAADSARYSDGKLYFTLGENTEESIGNTAEITVTLPTQNYTDFTFRITVTLAAKGDQQAPAQSDFRLELTSSGSDITAEIVTELSGVEFSFDGSDWGAENAAAVGHDDRIYKVRRNRHPEPEPGGLAHAEKRSRRAHAPRPLRAELHFRGQYRILGMRALRKVLP